ncbi:MAG: hypothetical protein FGM33_06955 [Candidatus Kapabacteria bacterium]|nr:hypothetical protein [Candidatus Kapabacteria bacterium]
MRAYILLLPVAALLISCSKTSTVEPTPETVKAPNVGSTFMYSFYQVDKVGAKVPGTDNEIATTILDANLARNGRSGVWSIRLSSGTTVDTSYMCLDANKDLLVATELNDGSEMWVRYPITTGKPFQSSTISKTEVDGVPAEFRTTITVDTNGTAPLTVGSESISTKSYLSTMTIQLVVQGLIVAKVVLKESAWVSPKLCTMIQKTALEQDLPNGDKVDGYFQKLKSYSLR